MSFGGLACVVTSYQTYTDSKTLSFHALYRGRLRAAADTSTDLPWERAYGVLSLTSASWTLFRRKPSGISEISRTEDGAKDQTCCLIKTNMVLMLSKVESQRTSYGLQGAEIKLLIEGSDGEMHPNPACPMAIPYSTGLCRSTRHPILYRSLSLHSHTLQVSVAPLATLARRHVR